MASLYLALTFDKRTFQETVVKIGILKYQDRKEKG
jgi:hypothetical protein